MPSPLAPLLASTPVQVVLNYTLRPVVFRLGLADWVASWRYRPLRALVLPRPHHFPPRPAKPYHRLGLRWLLYPGEGDQWSLWAQEPHLVPDALGRLLVPSTQTLVLDVGANIGQTSLLVALAASHQQLGPETLQLWAFEPNPRTRACLDQNLAQNPTLSPYIRLWPVGVSDTPGIALLADADTRHTGAAFVSAEGTIRIETVTVDAVLARERPTFERLIVKVDVEGHELHVLRGAADTLRTYRPTLVLEVADSHLRRAGGSAAELLGYLRDLGYTEFLDVATNRPAPTDPAHLNGVFMNLLTR